MEKQYAWQKDILKKLKKKNTTTDEPETGFNLSGK